VIEISAVRVKSIGQSLQSGAETGFWDLYTIKPAGSETVLCLHNVSAAEVMVSLPTGRFTDLLSDQGYQSTAQLAPYQVMWLREEA